MIVDETIANIQKFIAHVGENTRLFNMECQTTKAILAPVIGSPQWFLDEVRETFGQGRTDYEVDEIAGLKVIQREELSEPVVVMPDGRFYTVVPEWARRTAQQLQSEDFARQVTAQAPIAPSGA